MNPARAFSLLVLTGLLSACGGPSDPTPPTVAVQVSPTTLVAPGPVTFTATASDASGVARVEFYDGSTLVATDAEAPYTATKSYGPADNGARTIRARAYDPSGNAAEASATLTVAIADANEPNDSVASATPLTVGTPVRGVITGQDRDMDYFKFTATAGQALRLMVKSTSVDAASTLDPQVTILMPDGKTVLERDDDGGAGLESDIRFNAPADGTYTAVVTSFAVYDDETAKDDKTTNTYQVTLAAR